MKKSKVVDRATVMASMSAFNTLGIGDRSSGFAMYCSYLQWKKGKGDYLAMKVAAQHRQDLIRVCQRMIAKNPGGLDKQNEKKTLSSLA